MENQSGCNEIENGSNESNDVNTLAAKLERKNLILCKGSLNNIKDSMDQTF